MNKKIHECEVCGHKGRDVKFQNNPYKSGYFCSDQEDCFKRYSDNRDAEHERLQEEFKEMGSN